MNWLKVRPTLEPMMMLGGSPIRVAVPPMLEMIAWLITYILGSRPMPAVSSMMIGMMIRTVVTLSRKADRTAVTMEKRIRIFKGLPWVSSAMRTETIEKKPDFRRMATMDIMPSSSMIVSKSINSMAVCSLTTRSTIRIMTPSNAATALLTSSKVRATYTRKNTTIGISDPSILNPFHQVG
jgi:hypothetical protein